MSLWLKRGINGSNATIFAADSSNRINFDGTSDAITLYAGQATVRATSTAIFRDFAAWYHVVIVRNGGQIGTTSTWTIYVNNQVILTYTGNGGTFTSAVTHYIGSTSGVGNGAFDGYMAEINFIGGQALTPADFAVTDATTGQWIAKPYSGTYGTNGFYLQFNDGTSTTTLCADRSGNSNNWTPIALTRAAGINDCWMRDVPSGNAGVSDVTPNSNYCVLSPVDKEASMTLSNANLRFSFSGSFQVGRATFGVSSGKWYWEFHTSANTPAAAFGISDARDNMFGWPGTGIKLGLTANSYAYYAGDGQKYNNSAAAAMGTTLASTDVGMCAMDLDTGRIWWGKNGTWFASGNPALGTNAAYTGLTGTKFPAVSCNTTALMNMNFGQRAFAHTPPSGFKALCTSNLPTAAIPAGNKQFGVTLWTGNGTAQSIINEGGFQPDLIWAKDRSVGYNNDLTDSVRGIGRSLYSNATVAEALAPQVITALNANGFSIGSDVDVNANAVPYVAWQWKAGSSTVSNSSGSITSQVRANPTAGFSIVTYTGTGVNATIGHGLGVAPALIILKRRDAAGNWRVRHKSIAAANAIEMNSTAGATAAAPIWNSTLPSATVFSVGTGADANASGGTYVAYCFAEIPGFSKADIYTGNGNAVGQFVYLGFRPKFLLIKRTDTTSNWTIADSERDDTNIVNLQLNPHTAGAEATTTDSGTPYLDFLANGFKLRGSSVNQNASGGTYIYIAFAENPFQYANAR
jgi:hypothetical protein